MKSRNEIALDLIEEIVEHTYKDITSKHGEIISKYLDDEIIDAIIAAEIVESIETKLTGEQR